MISHWKKALLVALLFASHSALALSLKVVGLNVWAVPIVGVSDKIHQRLHLIPAAVAKTGADIVVIEEAWLDDYKEILIYGFKQQGYSYFQYGDAPRTALEKVSGRKLLGNGLLIVSKFPLSHFQSMAFSGYTRADEYAAGKGAIYVEVSMPDKSKFDLFATHLGAFTTLTIKIDGKEISDHMDPHHVEVKFQQAKELTAFIKSISHNSAMLLVGDLNTHYFPFYNGSYDTTKLSDVYGLMTQVLGLKDSFAVVHGLYGRDQNNIRSYTYDKETNNYAGDFFAAEPPDTIDYIFSQSDAFKPVDSKLILTEHIGANGKTWPSFLSDHYGLETTFDFSPEVVNK